MEKKGDVKNFMNRTVIGTLKNSQEYKCKFRENQGCKVSLKKEKTGGIGVNGEEGFVIKVKGVHTCDSTKSTLSKPGSVVKCTSKDLKSVNLITMS